MAIQIRRGTDAQWEANKSNIIAGEPAIATDTGRLFVGTGTGTYKEYPNKDAIYVQNIPSKNLLPLFASKIKELNPSFTWSGDVATKNGLTITLQSSSGGVITGIKVNGTCTANTGFDLTERIPNDFYQKKLNGSEQALTGQNGILVSYFDANGTWKAEQFSVGGADSTVNNSQPQIVFAIYIKSGTSASNAMFYPMVRETVHDATFVPYALVNSQLGRMATLNYSVVSTF